MCVTVGWFQVVLALVGAACAATIPVEAPKPVTGTEEVVQAKAEFKAAAAAEAVPELSVPAGAPSPVMDTKEVAEAKAKFKAAYDAAAAAAEAAPDTDLDGMLSTLDGRLSPLYNRYGFPINAVLPYPGLSYAGLPGVLPYSNLQAALIDDIPATLPYPALSYSGLAYSGIPYAGLQYAGLPGFPAIPTIKVSE